MLQKNPNQIDQDGGLTGKERSNAPSCAHLLPSALSQIVAEALRGVEPVEHPRLELHERFRVDGSDSLSFLQTQMEMLTTAVPAELSRIVKVAESVDIGEHPLQHHKLLVDEMISLVTDAEYRDELISESNTLQDKIERIPASLRDARMALWFMEDTLKTGEFPTKYIPASVPQSFLDIVEYFTATPRALPSAGSPRRHDREGQNGEGKDLPSREIEPQSLALKAKETFEPLGDGVGVKLSEKGIRISFSDERISNAIDIGMNLSRATGGKFSQSLIGGAAVEVTMSTQEQFKKLDEWLNRVIRSPE